MTKESITEEMQVHQEWYKEANSMTLEQLPEFLRKLTEDYRHDYETICHAYAAGAIATMWAMNKTPTGGITGFQASCIMWELIKGWMGYKGAMKLVKYDEMLSPQYDYKFSKTISRDTFQWLQEEAKKNLEKADKFTHPDVIKHWQNIVDGIVPFGFTIAND
jgi:hypothetical protein